MVLSRYKGIFRLMKNKKDKHKVLWHFFLQSGNIFIVRNIYVTPNRKPSTQTVSRLVKVTDSSDRKSRNKAVPTISRVCGL